jgi:SPP1 family predicted phage head-tail adaptor
MPLIQTQRLDRRIDILKYTKTKNEFFEWVETWEKERAVWCSVKQQYFRDYQETFGTKLENTVNFIVRYETGLYFDNSKRISYNGKTFEIINILEGSFARDFTTIVAKQVKG